MDTKRFAVLGDLFMGVVSAYAGSKIAEHEEHEKDKKAEASESQKPKTIGEVLRDSLTKKWQAEQLNRQELDHALEVENSRQNGGVQLIRDLFDEFEREHIIKVGGRYYTENDTGLWLMSIPIKYRSTEWARLNDLLIIDPTRVKFFARLEIYNDNRFQQKFEKTVAIIEDQLSSADDATVDKLRPLRIKLQKAARDNRIDKGYKYP